METMGQKFRAAREKKKMNVSRAAALTHIKVQNIEMMENDDFTKMPAPTYAKGFIRIYAAFLGLDPVPLVQEYVDEHLNSPAEKPRASRSRNPEPLIENVPDEPRETSPRKSPEILPALQKTLNALLPHLPRLAGSIVIVFILVSVARCAVRLGSSSSDKTEVPAKLDPHSIMKEPPVRYLELPAAEEKP